MMNSTITASFSTGEYHGYNVKYSPFRKNFLACAASENYGIAGKGRLFVFEVHNGKSLSIVATRDWPDGLYDVAWSELNQQLLLTSCGDGSIQIWDIMGPAAPVNTYKIHNKEVFSVEWNPKNVFSHILSASWDRTVKVYDPFSAKEVVEFNEHTDQVYEACWNPHRPEIFSSVSGDRTMRLWDFRIPKSVECSTLPSEVLCCDWTKTDPEFIAVGTVEGNIYEFDVRKPSQPLFILSGHEYAIRQLKFSPFERGKLASVSYDFTTRFWNWNVAHALQIHKNHTEFVYGFDFSPMKRGESCDCAWDSYLYIYSD